MPLVASTAYNQLAGVNNLIRSLLNDKSANVFTDNVLTPYVNSAYRTIQRKISNAGGGEFKTDNVYFIIPAIPEPDQTVQAVLNDAGYDFDGALQQLPTNLLQPIKIWERINLSNQDFIEVHDLTEDGGLPARRQSTRLQFWEWRTDGIYFPGALQDTQIRLRYQSFLPDLIDQNDFILIRGAQECIAQGAAALAAGSRGSPMAEKMDNLFNDSVEDVIVENVRTNQSTGKRRRPFRGGGGRR